MKNLNLLIEYKSPNELIPNPKNPNVHTKEQIERLSEIIKFQGFRRPISVSRSSGFVIVGHGRLEAAKLLKLEKVPVVFQDYENEAQEYADMVADNEIARWANLDMSLLKEDMQILGDDFNLDLLGVKDNHFLADRINRGDENSEWVGMPDFEVANKDVKLILIFETEQQRNIYCEDNNIVITHKQNNQWTSRI